MPAPAAALTDLRSGAEALAAPLPPLLARAERLAASVLPGGHGRRRAGPGEAFWQYRPAVPGDGARALDWRRSARSDASFVRETEWQLPQSVTLWVDRSRAMSFAAGGRPPKSDRARLLGLALALLLLRGGERVGLAGDGRPPGTGRVQAAVLTNALLADEDGDFGAPPAAPPRPGSRLILLSDFMGEPAATEAALRRAAEGGVRGSMVQVLDPAEEAFPFHGRTRFESMGGAVEFETRRAAALRGDYARRLAERRARLQGAAARAGWTWRVHRTDASAAAALLALWRDTGGSF